jgi:hypothetical protein
VARVLGSSATYSSEVQQRQLLWTARPIIDLPTSWQASRSLIATSSGRSDQYGGRTGDRGRQWRRGWDPFGTTHSASERTSRTSCVPSNGRSTFVTCGNVYSNVLGVKGSQVQILSSRRSTRGPLIWRNTRSTGFIASGCGDVQLSEPDEDRTGLTHPQAGS